MTRWPPTSKTKEPGKEPNPPLPSPAITLRGEYAQLGWRGGVVVVQRLRQQLQTYFGPRRDWHPSARA